MRDLRLIDMFCGAGLFSAGFQDAGFRPVLAIDVAGDAIASYNRNVAAVAVTGSVTQFDSIPEASVLIAGPPCQGFSTLGRQDPLDKRNSLALEVPRWAAASNADVVVVENVPPFLRSSHWRAMADQLEACGYEVTTWVLDAADHGTPQFRTRGFTIASKVGLPAAPVPTARANAAEAFSRCVNSKDPMHTWPEPTALAASRIRLVPPKGDKRDIMRLAPEICPASWAKVGCQATDVWGRMDPDKPANTLRCTFQNPSKGRYLHPTEDRVLSLREGARLQGVPDDWTFVGKPYPVARQIGNGVPVPLARAVATQVMALTQRHISKAA
jgi:DNA (cytosine-5)-methyltransferase 1|tara:strand:- start:8328 stop:9308 length:981 start_codon:yes stop_codon:yes gene_type:complete